MANIQSQQSRLLIRYNRLFEKQNTDFSVFGFLGAQPDLGVNATKTVNDNLVTYFEFSVRKGRNPIFTDFSGTSGTNQQQDTFVDAMFGVNYTFNNGLNLVMEYWHKGSGYTAQQWNQLESHTQAATRLLQTREYLLGINQLVQLNQALNPIYLRQDYFFSRLNYTNTFAELSLLYLFNLSSG